MKNEVFDSKINKMKRNIIVYLIGLALISLAFKMINDVKIDLVSGMMEFYILATSLLVFTIQICRIIGVPAKDEKMIRERNIINHFGFYIVLLGGIGVHFISNLMYQGQLLLERNSFISLAILLGFIVAIFSARKQGFYLNYKHIEKPMKDYFKSVLWTLGKLALVAVGYATVIYSLSLSLAISFDKIILILGSILLSLIFFSIEYLMFSIYEKLDYDEKVLYAKEHITTFLSKKIILIGLPIIGFGIIRTAVYFLISRFENLGNIFVLQQLNVLLRLLDVWHIDFIILGLILSYTIYRSIKLLPVEKPRLFKYFPILIWITFAYGLVKYGYTTLINLLIPGNQSYLADSISNISSYIFIGTLVLALLLYIYMYPFLKKNNFPAIKILLLLPILLLVTELVLYVLPSVSNGGAAMRYQMTLIQLISVIVTNILIYYVYCRMSFEEFKLMPPLEKKDAKTVALNKTLTH